MAEPIVVGTLLRRSKRARTAQPCRRDWANLTAGPAGLIAQQVLEDDVAGYLRFRAVCGAWRRCTEPPCVHGSLDSRFHPRRWIMLPEIFAANVDRRDFLNVSTGERIRVDLPELRDRLVIGATSGGLLVLLCGNDTHDMHLLNPLTRQLTALPNAASLLRGQENITWLSELEKLQVSSAGLADSSTVALYFDDRKMELAVAKPGDERWSCRAWQEPGFIISALSFANRFYCASKKGINVVDAIAAVNQPQLAVVVEEGEPTHESYLVDNDGELIRVQQAPVGTKTPRYHAHRVDLAVGQMVRIYDLRGRAVFVGDDGRSVSVHAGLSSSIKADTVYWCKCSGDGTLGIAAYHVKNGWTTWNLHASPGSMVDYLSRYVCRSEDTVVPAPTHRCRIFKVAATVADPRKRKGKRKRKANSKVIGNDWVN